MTNKSLKIFGGETTREEMVLGAKRLGYGGETTRVENRGETTRGGNVFGAKRLVTVSLPSLVTGSIKF